MNWQVERKDGSLNILFRVHAKMRGWLACFMSDGSIAAVGNNARKVEFKNIHIGEYSEVNSRKLYDGCKSGRYCSFLL